MFIVCWVFCNVFFSDSLKKVKAGPIMQIASSFKRLSSLQGLPHRSPKAMTILFFLLLLFYAAMILLPWKTSINKARKWKKRQEKGRKERKKSGKNYISSLKSKIFGKNCRKVYITTQQKNIFLNDVNSLFLCNSYFWRKNNFGSFWKFHAYIFLTTSTCN